ncbi:hypothetical protein EOM86_05635 [Candidatus Nomurabacteria bacterium]|nr:hypothetical protein [Candidatus Nomurabacteria bacterium]
MKKVLGLHDQLIIGIHGFMGSGKTAASIAVAKFITEAFPTATIAYAHIGSPIVDLILPTIGKECLIPQDPMLMSGYFNLVVPEKRLSQAIKSRAISVDDRLITVRYLLQETGVELRRLFGDEILISTVLSDERIAACNVVILDGVRYQSDVDYIKRNYGMTITLDSEVAKERSDHESEQKLAGVDMKLNNPKRESQQEAVDVMYEGLSAIGEKFAGYMIGLEKARINYIELISKHDDNERYEKSH